MKKLDLTFLKEFKHVGFPGNLGISTKSRWLFCMFLEDIQKLEFSIQVSHRTHPMMQWLPEG